MKITLIQIMIGFSLHIGKLVYKFLNEMLKDINVSGSVFLSQTYFLSLSNKFYHKPKNPLILLALTVFLFDCRFHFTLYDSC